MTTIRQELETRLSVFAAALSPPVPVSYENVSFNRPATGPFLECFVNSGSTVNVTVDGTRTRERGVFQINVWFPSGGGMAKPELLAAQIVAAFPVVPKTGNVSIEQTPNTKQALLDVSGWIIIPISCMYRYEGTV